jgi:hypothetical protein
MMSGPGRGQPPYLAYLLRLWPALVRGRLALRGSLEEVRTHERLGFTGLDELCARLNQATEGLWSDASEGVDEGEEATDLKGSRDQG